MLEDLRRKKQLHILIQLALDEDLGRGDATEELFSPIQGHWQLKARQAGIFCGAEVASELFSQSQLPIETLFHKKNGESFVAGELLQEYRGPSSLLSVERILLNILQHLCAISSETGRWVNTLNNSNCQILDTRKTTPAWRYLEKYAVLCGGGHNHRMALDDAIMIKDNHHARQGNPKGDKLTQWITEIVQQANVPVIVEVESSEDCLATAKAFPTVILLDNMSVEELRDCVAGIKKMGSSVLLEASGGITLDRLEEIANTGVHRISVGALTQNPPRIDLGLDAL